ncbi:hypothetical protein TRAPUB_1545 [Trametes pubescens]|uniref:Uncharacterized protein n=1 Tax=Trametes pubescens TaxID=154538 RepID=A0A1M2VJ38_TRAPU|nr:hypothetical protein TRAPUB_1545 [Trametes pubescens]
MTHISITIAHLETELPVTETELQTMADAWPNLVEFEIDVKEIDGGEEVLDYNRDGRPSPRSLITFAERHPRLVRLVWPFVGTVDASAYRTCRTRLRSATASWSSARALCGTTASRSIASSRRSHVDAWRRCPDVGTIRAHTCAGARLLVVEHTPRLEDDTGMELRTRGPSALTYVARPAASFTRAVRTLRAGRRPAVRAARRGCRRHTGTFEGTVPGFSQEDTCHVAVSIPCRTLGRRGAARSLGRGGWCTRLACPRAAYERTLRPIERRAAIAGDVWNRRAPAPRRVGPDGALGVSCQDEAGVPVTRGA